MKNMEQTTTRTKFGFLIYKINLIMCYLICIWMTLPFFRFRAGVSMLMLFFMIWIITTDLRWLTKKWPLDLSFVLVFFITFIPYLITGNLQYGLVGPKAILINFPLFFFGVYINHYYMYYKKDYKALRKIVLVTLIFFGIGSLQTYIGLQVYPMASRILAGGNNYYSTQIALFNQIGIGGFGYIYSACLLFVSVLYLVLKNKREMIVIDKIIVILSATLLLLMIIQSSYATALLLIMSGIILLTVAKNKRTLVFSMFLCGILLLLVPISLIGNMLINFANLFRDNYVIYERLSDLGMSFLQESRGTLTNTRLELYTTSLSTFINQPIFGIYGPFGNISSKIGGHSGWLDLLAFYGLFTGIPLFLIIYYNFKKHLIFYRGNNYYRYIIVIQFLFLLFGTINPMLYIFEIGFLMFLIIPIIPFLSNNFRSKV